MWELQCCYTLDEALKLYALHSMDLDIERAKWRDSQERGEGR